MRHPCSRRPLSYRCRIDHGIAEWIEGRSARMKAAMHFDRIVKEMARRRPTERNEA
jgi:hypothetical protein